MARLKIVVWDNIGNTLLGVRPWSSWPEPIRDWMLVEDASGPQRAPDFATLFAGHDVHLEWWINDPAIEANFFDLGRNYRASIRHLEHTDQLVETIRDADYVIIHKETLPPEAIAGATKLKLLQHLGEDFRGVPLAACRERGIPVAATPLVNYIAVAEHVWAFILNWAKKLPELRQHMIDAGSGDQWNITPGIRLVREMTLGLLGFGEIARPIAKVARAFDMPVIYWDIRRFRDLEAEYGVRYVEWDEVFRQSDVLSVQLALNAQTEGIIGPREISLMKPTALYINTARGKLADQEALIASLEAGKLGGLALDVFQEEPLPAGHRLRALSADPANEVTLTPHIGWQGPWTWVTDSRVLWDNVLASLGGGQIRHLVEE